MKEAQHWTIYKNLLLANSFILMFSPHDVNIKETYHFLLSFIDRRALWRVTPSRSFKPVPRLLRPPTHLSPTRRHIFTCSWLAYLQFFAPPLQAEMLLACPIEMKPSLFAVTSISCFWKGVTLMLSLFYTQMFLNVVFI